MGQENLSVSVCIIIIRFIHIFRFRIVIVIIPDETPGSNLEGCHNDLQACLGQGHT